MYIIERDISMKIVPITNQAFKSKLPPANLNVNGKARYTDAWNDFACEAEKRNLIPEVKCLLDKISNDGNDAMLAFEKYTSEVGIENYYLGVYDDAQKLAQDRVNGKFLQNTINKNFIWFQKDSDGFFKIPTLNTFDKSNILGKTFIYVVMNLLNKILDKTSVEYKKLYGITSSEQLLRKYRAKI